MDYNLRILLGGGILVWLIPLILIGFIVLSIYKIKNKNKIYYNEAYELLKKRYANGELSRNEYEKMLKIIEK